MTKTCPKCGAEAVRIVQRAISNNVVYGCRSTQIGDTLIVEADCLRRQLAACQKELAEAKGMRELADGCLIMIGECLEELGCQCGKESLSATPPMNYPEWIMCVIRHKVSEAAKSAGEANHGE